ncbi:MAG: NADH-quinone oxidoreductase subunit H, partial [Thermoplasmata archaeon]|nr:NADH-quinone oxidoreductase subunit H [Candidatus Sysuiplasma superficiale]
MICVWESRTGDNLNYLYSIAHFISALLLGLVGLQNNSFLEYGLSWLIASVILLVVVLVNVIILIYVERKELGRFMDRRGPMVVGPAGFFQNFADAFKFLVKEMILPESADPLGFNGTLVIIVASSLLIMAVVPQAPDFYFVNSDLGLLLAFAIFAIEPFAVVIAGWASNNKYSLLGGFRSTAQMMSYEVPLLITVISVAILAGSFNFMTIVNEQSSHVWYVLPLAIGFIVFLVSMVAEIERIPFDTPDAEAELVHGWMTEYPGIKFAFLQLTSYVRSLAGAAIMVLLFLGGWTGPLLPPL